MSEKLNEFKQCNACDMEKPIDEFSKRGKGYSAACKECVKQKGAATREKKKADKQKSDTRTAFNEHWKQTADQIDTFDLTQISDLLKEYQKQIKNMM